MAKGISIKTSGLTELQKKIKQLPQALKDEFDGALGEAAYDFEQLAVNDVPIDTGFLKGEISVIRRDPMHYEVISGARYSAYVEFGTINHVEVPSDLVSYASLFKGKGIKTNGGMIARPFFFKQRAPVMESLQKKLEPIIKKAMK